jgi:hypothetical protein
VFDIANRNDDSNAMRELAERTEGPVLAALDVGAKIGNRQEVLFLNPLGICCIWRKLLDELAD